MLIKRVEKQEQLTATHNLQCPLQGRCLVNNGWTVCGRLRKLPSPANNPDCWWEEGTCMAKEAAVVRACNRSAAVLGRTPVKRPVSSRMGTVPRLSSSRDAPALTRRLPNQAPGRLYPTHLKQLDMIQTCRARAACIGSHLYATTAEEIPARRQEPRTAASQTAQEVGHHLPSRSLVLEGGSLSTSSLASSPRGGVCRRATAGGSGDTVGVDAARSALAAEPAPARGASVPSSHSRGLTMRPRLLVRLVAAVAPAAGVSGVSASGSERLRCMAATRLRAGGELVSRTGVRGAAALRWAACAPTGRLSGTHHHLYGLPNGEGLHKRSHQATALPTIEGLARVLDWQRPASGERMSARPQPYQAYCCGTQ